MTTSEVSAIVGPGHDIAAVARAAAWITKHRITPECPAFELADQLDPFVHRLMGRNDIAGHNVALAVCNVWARGARVMQRAA